jgi:hypothetical protein
MHENRTDQSGEEARRDAMLPASAVLRTGHPAA